MDKTLSFLVSQSAQALERLERNEDSSMLDGRDYCGFRAQVEQYTDYLIAALFPHHAEEEQSRSENLEQGISMLEYCLQHVLPATPSPKSVILALLESLPGVRRQLQTDLIAAYQGDPAAKSLDEIILCYPAFTAISTYRLAHVLYQEKVPLLPRMMTEYAHRLTGIDIHPGATIGDFFFIDHGTGVVIGETTTIGEHVKLYQHVTLGAKSFEVGADGTLVKGIKRHPDIGDRVVIYSGATILGGSTHIGNDCVIGGSVWLTQSVPAGKMVLARVAVTDTPLTKDIATDPVLDSAML